jgi:D-glycero-alpha-D-manno-heptose 1-phosphate guanylyltransferase
MKCIAVILAGGLGMRLRHVLPHLPKSLAPVYGKPFLEWVIQFLAKQNIFRIIISTGYLADQIEKFALRINAPRLELQCIKEDLPLGTAGGVLNVLERSNVKCDNVLILNGDSLALVDLSPLFSALEEVSNGVALLGIWMSDAERYGTLEVNKFGLLEGFKEKHPGSGLVNVGVYLFRRHLLDGIQRGKPMSFEIDVFPSLINQGVGIKVIEVKAPFIDIGTEESLGGASLFFEKNSKYFSEKGI